MTKLKPLTRYLVSSRSSKPTEEGESDDFAAFARLDLGKAAYYLPVLSASKPQLELFDEIWKEGMKPEEWLDTYLERANLI
uniref:Uncharacterized protein n=1 Tax=Escherichia coli TaxID=562 RepID=A0A809T0Y3_ECOLX|nr:hypothetical protein [Escherichia coli]